MTALHQVPDPAFSERDKRKLGRHEKSVQDYQRKN
jgi:hypothetical protein